MTYYYAEYNRYGIGTLTEIGGRVQSAGNLYRFKSRKDRDDWVESDQWDGQYHRAAITRKEAERLHNGAFHERAFWEMKDDKSETFIGKV